MSDRFCPSPICGDAKLQPAPGGHRCPECGEFYPDAPPPPPRRPAVERKRAAKAFSGVGATPGRPEVEKSPTIVPVKPTHPPKTVGKPAPGYDEYPLSLDAHAADTTTEFGGATGPLDKVKVRRVTPPRPKAEMPQGGWWWFAWAQSNGGRHFLGNVQGANAEAASQEAARCWPKYANPYKPVRGGGLPIQFRIIVEMHARQPTDEERRVAGMRTEIRRRIEEGFRLTDYPEVLKAAEACGFTEAMLHPAEAAKWRAMGVRWREEFGGEKPKGVTAGTGPVNAMVARRGKKGKK